LEAVYPSFPEVLEEYGCCETANISAKMAFPWKKDASANSAEINRDEWSSVRKYFGESCFLSRA